MQGALADLLREIGRMDRRLDALQAAETGAAGGGTGTVTSVALSLPAIFTVSGSPVTTAGTLTAVLAIQAANRVWAGPTSGGAAAPTFRALVAADLPAGTGTVTSVALSLPAIFTVSGSPVTTAGTLTATLATQVANRVWAGPTTGADAAPTFRALVAADLPAGTGTVTSVALSLPAIFTVSGSPVTTAGTLTATLATQAANLVWAGPTTGAAAAPTFRALVAADMSASVAGTTSKLAKFTATNAVGDSIVTESGSKIQVSGSVEVIGQANTNQLVVKGHSTQTSGQIVIQTSAAAELARIYVVAANYSMGIGYLAGQSVTGDANLAIGANALKTTVSGYNNTAIGKNTLMLANNSAHDNVAIGYNSQSAVTSGLYNLSIGTDSMVSNQTGSSNVGVGMNALRACTGSENTGVGGYTGYYNSTGAQNVYIGASAGTTCLGSRNIIIGFTACEGTQATYNDSVYIGYKSGNGASCGDFNVAIGRESLQATVTKVTAIGYQAGKAATGTGNVFVGYQAGLTVGAGANNTLIGSGAGASLSTNGGCVMIGYQAGGNETAANKLYIHNSNSTTPLIYGDFSTPSLTFNGTVNIQDAKNIVLGTTTGTQLGSGATQKLALWGATPIVQPTTGVAAATFVANAGTAVNDASTFDGYTIKQLVKALRNMGALA